MIVLHRCYVARFLAVAIAVAATGPARALEEDIWTYTVGGGLSYDDNLLRLPNGVSAADVGLGQRPRGTWIGNAFARIAFNAPVSRQIFRGFVQGNAYRYDDYSYLNWEGVDFNATWLWVLGNRWEGTLSFAQGQSLSGLDDFRALTQNIITVDEARATAEYWLHPRWRLTAAFTGVYSRNSSDVLRFNDLDQYTYGAGFKYVSTEQNYVIFGARYTDGEYPERELPTFLSDNRFTQYDVGVDLSWGIGGNAELIGNIAYTQRKLPNIPSRDFSGPTGNLRLNWRWTGKTGVNIGIFRGLGAATDVSANYIVTNTLTVSPYWQATQRLRVQAIYAYEFRDYQGDPGIIPGLPQREDTLNSAGLSAIWTPTRNWQLGLSYLFSTRSSNFPSSDFNDNTFTGTVQFAW